MAEAAWRAEKAGGSLDKPWQETHVQEPEKTVETISRFGIKNVHSRSFLPLLTLVVKYRRTN